MNRVANLYYHPNRAVRYASRVSSAAGAVAAASRYLGNWAPTTKDLNFVYNYAKNKFRSGRASRYSGIKRVSRKGFPKKIKSQIKELRRLAESDMGTLVYRKRETTAVLASANARNISNQVHSHVTMIETALAQLRYYDPAAPTNLVTASGATGTYQKDFYIKRQYSKCTLANNYQVPCEATIYLCRPKVDTTITPGTAWDNGLTDSSNASSASPIVFPSDSEQFRDLWRVEKTVSKRLMPGQSCSAIMSDKPFHYDPSTVDSHTSTYQTQYRSGIFLVCVVGVQAHDSSAAEYGRCPAGVDVETDTTVEIQYSAGADIRYTYVTDGSDSFTNGAVVSAKPVVDNQSYSVA